MPTRPPEVAVHDLREWIATNNLGDFAMGTISRINTRKYHGLLSVRNCSETPIHALAEVAEVLVCGDERFELGSFQYGHGLVHPHGHRHLTRFNGSSGPSWFYSCGARHVLRRLDLLPDRHVVRLTWEIAGAKSGDVLLLYPHFTMRGIHECARENAFLLGKPHAEHDMTVFQFYPDLPEIGLRVSPSAELEAAGFWNQRVFYAEEQRRGYDAHEDLFCPGAVKVPVQPDTKIVMEVGMPSDLLESKAVEPLGPSDAAPILETRLSEGAEQFLFENAARQPGVVAGLPWFGEWSRDTMVSLEGLLLARKQFNRAAAIIERYAQSRENGLLPNILGAVPSQNAGVAPDASLLLIRVLQQVEAASGHAAAERWLPAAFEIMEALASQRVHGIGVTPEGLLAADRDGEALTWMDVKVDGKPLTPRAPYAVELNALYYNALRFTLEAARRSGHEAFVERFSPLTAQFEQAFMAMFWSEERGWFADSHDGHRADFSLRPNQLFAISLPYSCASHQQALGVLKHVREKLLTPRGLRTLASDEPGYHGRCEGSHNERDAAYHNGTVWPWLLMPYLDAVAAHEGAQDAAQEAARLLHGFAGHLDEACVGQVSEIFDGDEPHTPRGAPAQAWSVAALLSIARHLEPAPAAAPAKRRATSVKRGTKSGAKRKTAAKTRAKAMRE
jgi:predicted glycogen debranching enzyme